MSFSYGFYLKKLYSTMGWTVTITSSPLEYFTSKFQDGKINFAVHYDYDHLSLFTLAWL